MLHPPPHTSFPPTTNSAQCPPPTPRSSQCPPPPQAALSAPLLPQAAPSTPLIHLPQTKYCNPHCACPPRVKYASLVHIGLSHFQLSNGGGRGSEAVNTVCFCDRDTTTALVYLMYNKQMKFHSQYVKKQLSTKLHEHSQCSLVYSHIHMCTYDCVQMLCMPCITLGQLRVDSMCSSSF